MADPKVSDVENSVRDAKNWLAAFKTEYKLADEVVKVLHGKLDDLGKSVAGIKSAGKKIDAASVKPVANTLRDLKNWLAAFKTEYKLADEVIKVLHKEFDKIGDKLAALK